MTTLESALAEILGSVFCTDPGGLRASTRRIYGTRIASKIGGVTAADLAESLAAKVVRDGLTTTDLLAALRDEHPLHAQRIIDLASRHGICLPPASGGAPDSPLSPAWFQARLDESLAQLDRRFILGILGPDAHVRLHIEELLDAVARGPALQARWEEVLDNLAHATRWPRHLDAVMAPDRAQALPAELGALAVEAGRTRLDGLDRLELEGVRAKAGAIRDEVEAAWAQSWERSRRVVVPDTPATDAGRPPASARLGDARWWLRQVLEALQTLTNMLDDPRLQVATRGVLAVTGAGGTGKSHLLAHAAQAWLDQGRPSVLVLGEHVGGRGPAAEEILRLLGSPGPRFWDDLEALAEQRAQRAVVMVDALNETEAPTWWKQHLRGLLAFMARRPNIAFVFSVRSEYIEDVLPTGVLGDIPSMEHRGFEDVPPHQLLRVFQAYALHAPRALPALSELRNPLLLHLVCAGLKNQDAKGFDDLPNGALALWDFVLEDFNRRLAAPERLDFDRRADVVAEAMVVVAATMAAEGTAVLPRTRLREPVQAVLARHCFASSPRDLLRELKREGLLVEVAGGRTEQGERLRFQFQRLGELFQARAILSEAGSHVDVASAVLRFLDRIAAEASGARKHRGVLQALSLLLGEVHDLELVDLCSDHALAEEVAAQWRESLPQRSTRSIGDAACVQVEAWLRSGQARVGPAYSLLLQLALRPDHPLNADFLHALLAGQPMPRRDQGWSEYLYRSDADEHPLTVLRSWVDASSDAGVLGPDVGRLAAVVLAWSFTTSHRPVRDRGTKSLVRLLNALPSLAAPLLQRFASVDDPYVVERVVAGVYGAATRTADPRLLTDLARTVWGCFFASGSPPQHILLRDHARSILELAHHRGLLPADLDIEATRPPYAVVPFRVELPSLRALRERLGRNDGDYGPHSEILRSMSEMGDFWRYVVGTNSGFDPGWSCQPRGGGPNLRERWHKEFAEALSPAQRRLWDAVWAPPDPEVLTAAEPAQEPESDGSAEPYPEPAMWEQSHALDRAARSLTHALVKTLANSLTEEQRELYSSLDKGLRLPDGRDELDTFPAALAQRWMLQRILDLGWEEAELGPMDRSRSHEPDRTAHKPERLGKKYQWLAWHSFLAALEDAFTPREEKPWSRPPPAGFAIRERDIDPTCLVARTQGRSRRNGAKRCWWCPVDYGPDITRDPPERWATNASGLPQLTDLLDIEAPDGHRWLVLAIHREWEEARPVGMRSIEVPARRYSLLVRSVVTRRAEVDALGTWLGAQRLMGRWFPEHERGHDRLRECWWHPAAHAAEPLGDAAWRRIDRDGQQGLGVPTHVDLLYEAATTDCSVEETFDIRLPTPWLVAALGLIQGPQDGTWVDARGAVVCQDPSLAEPGMSALLLRRDMLAHLEEQGFTLLWSGLGELLGEEEGEARYVASTSAAAWLAEGQWRSRQWQHDW